MNALPFSLNIFKQVEIFQDIKRLDDKFDIMLSKWKKGGYKKSGVADNLNINYPTWEIERKVLLWTVLNHKHLGSEIVLNSDQLKAMFISETEIGFANKVNVLGNLVARGLADWGESKKGILILQQGLDYGLVTEIIYKLKKDSFNEGEAKYRDYKLTKKQLVCVGYEFLYSAGLLTIFLSLLLLGCGVYKNLNLEINSPSWFLYIKYFVAFISFTPVILFGSGIFLITKK